MNYLLLVMLFSNGELSLMPPVPAVQSRYETRAGCERVAVPLRAHLTKSGMENHIFCVLSPGADVRERPYKIL